MDAAERQLLDDYRAGSAEALGELVEAYRRPLFAFIHKMTEGRGDADEVFQETWIRAIRNVDRFDNRNLLGWLFRIARNLVIDRVRREKMYAHPSSVLNNEPRSDWLQHVPGNERSPSGVSADRELGRRISTAVEGLPPEQREVFLMRMEADLSFKEIAHIQKVSINTALARMHYAVGKLRERLKDDYRELRGSET